jgi:calcineurin-like phosphoesterase family protein
MKLKLEPTQQLYFTSDTHYMHQNICRGTTRWSNADGFTRNFDTLDQMNDRIVNGINTTVGQDDILFHLGDWSFGGFERIEEFRNRINCKNIHIVLGNHDHHIERDREGIRRLFTSVNQYLELEVKGNDWEQNYVLMHYPIISWNKMNDGVIHLHGHVHLSADRRIGKGKTMDVGVDGNGLDPLHTSDIKRLMKDQPIKSGFEFDHHIKRFV